MEGLTTRVYRRVKAYWRRRGYERLGVTTTGLDSQNSGPSRRRRFWRIRISPRLKLRGSPKKFYVRLRDAYMRMMMKLANTAVVRSGAVSGYGGGGIAGFEVRPIKEYDEKMIIEIYKTLAAMDAPQIRSQNACTS